MQEVAHLLEQYQTDFSAALQHYPALQTLLDNDTTLQAQLQRLWLGSDYAADLCIVNTGLLLDLLSSGDLSRTYANWQEHLLTTNARLSQDTDTADTQNLLKQQLRIFRKREMLRILWRDSNSQATLLQTCSDLSHMADCCIHEALRVLTPLCQQQLGIALDEQGNEQQLIVLAMGKYGAWELNLSSDIDLMFVFPENSETTVPASLQKQFPHLRASTSQQYFQKLGQLLINVLDSTTSDGQVFRVDMRLRPYGNSGALALSIDAMEEYYQTQGRDWERFAMIKARAVTGEASSVANLMSMLRSFTYRRYIDFATIDSLRDLKRQIEQQVRRKSMHHNIKLGRGGIREIEFIVQVLQLIYGGRHKHLQQSSIMQAMDGLVQENCIPAADVAMLKRCYEFLRRTEHAIQALHDKQTHDYPQDAIDEYRVAAALNMENEQDLRTQLAQVRDSVSELFSRVIAAPENNTDNKLDTRMQQVWLDTSDTDRALSLLGKGGFANPESLLNSLHGYHESRQFLSLDAVSRERMDRFMPHLLSRVSSEKDPDLSFSRVFEFVQAVARRTVYLILLLENPVALSQLIMLCSASPWVVALLSRYPVLLDELLRPLDAPPDKAELSDKLRLDLLRTSTTAIDEQLVTMQNFKQEQVLTVAAAELSGTLPLMKVSDSLTWIAEVVLAQILDMTWQLMTQRYGKPFNAAGESGNLDFIIVGYGKLGGIELNYGSDLDLVFIHDGHPDMDTSGGENGACLNSGAFYVQLGQKILSLLNTHTVTGKLYEIDVRLRPSGASGSLVCSREAFSQYQHEHAWTWEHQALIRARVVTGSAALHASYATIREEVLGLKRDCAKLTQDIVSMRAKMRTQLGSTKTDDSFHLKHDAGGLVDIEFIVQYLVLAHAHEDAGLLRWSDNMRLLDMIASNGVLSASDAHALQNSYISYRSLLHKRALDNADYRLPADEFKEQRAVVQQIWERLFAGIEPGPLLAGSAKAGAA